MDTALNMYRVLPCRVSCCIKQKKAQSLLELVYNLCRKKMHQVRNLVTQDM